jgi:uncharacterized protein (UPF0548 family)
MLSLRKPTDESIRSFIKEQANLSFSYAKVGATAGTAPDGYALDHARTKLGEGEPIFHSARTALECWEQFQLGWVEASPRDTPLRAGEVVAVMGRAIGLWWLNACRIVYVEDEPGPIRRFGFAYGTLPGHVESGEERFLIEWDQKDNSVWYDILAFSRPNHFLAWMGYPFVRHKQEQFRRDSAASMLRAVRMGEKKNRFLAPRGAE